MVLVLGVAGALLAGGSLLAAAYMLAQTEFAYVHAFSVLFTGVSSGMAFIGLAFVLAELRVIGRHLANAAEPRESSGLAHDVHRLSERDIGHAAVREEAGQGKAGADLDALDESSSARAAEPAAASPAAVVPTIEVAAVAMPQQAPLARQQSSVMTAAEAAPVLDLVPEPEEPSDLPRQEVRRGLRVNLGARVRVRNGAEPESRPAPPARPEQTVFRPAPIPAPRTVRAAAVEHRQEPSDLPPLTAERPGSKPRRPPLKAQRF